MSSFKDSDGNEVSQATYYRRKKTKLQIQISNCRRMLRLQTERIAAINDPMTLTTLKLMIHYERELSAIEFGISTEDQPEQGQL